MNVKNIFRVNLFVIIVLSDGLRDSVLPDNKWCHLYILWWTGGIIMIILSNYLELIYDLSSRIIFLDSGRIIKDVVAINTEQRDEINIYFKF